MSSMYTVIISNHYRYLMVASDQSDALIPRLSHEKYPVAS